jgi:hypothetical protein
MPGTGFSPKGSGGETLAASVIWALGQNGVTLFLCCSACSSLAAATSPNLKASLVAEFVVG